MTMVKVPLLCFICSLCNAEFSNKWILKGNISKDRLTHLSSYLGFRFVAELPTGQYVLSRDDIPRSSKNKAITHTKKLLSIPELELIGIDSTLEDEVTFAEQEEWKKINKRQAYSIQLNDPLWNQMWYINEQKGNTMGILNAWKERLNGTGVNIGIIDDGVDYTHSDLTDRYIAKFSQDVYDDDKNPFPSANFAHGTKCAGVAVGTANNSVCVAGVAYGANLIAVRMIGPRGVLPSGQIQALTNQDVHISSNSWGGLDNTFDGPSEPIKDALKYGVTNLRNGKGVIYLFAGGNGAFDDNCNTDGYVNSIYTIGINSVAIDYDYPGYAEPCTAVLASAFSGSGAPSEVCSTTVSQGCVTDFTGTSAATPMAAGLLALLLQANLKYTYERCVTTLVHETGIREKLDYWREMCITNPMKPIDTYAELVDSYGTEYEHYHSKQIQGKQLHMKCCGEIRLTVLDSRGSIQFTYNSTTNSCNRSSNLTWRDVQELIVRTSRTDIFIYGEFKENGVGRKVSDWFGYGLLDLQKLLTTAANWTTLPTQHVCISSFKHVNQNIAKGDRLKRTIESSFKTDGCNDTSHCVNSIEHVDVQVIFDYSVRGVVELTLQAPSGTVSNLLTARNSDNGKNGRLDWTYMSVHHWGENPFGIWKLNMSINSNINEGGTLVGWKLLLYGTGEGCTKVEPETTLPTTTTTLISKTSKFTKSTSKSSSTTLKTTFKSEDTTTITIIKITGSILGGVCLLVIIITTAKWYLRKRNRLRLQGKSTNARQRFENNSSRQHARN